MSAIKRLGIQKEESLKKGNTDSHLNNNGFSGQLFHVVNLKENLLSISQKYKMSPNELKKINGLKEDKIYLGQVINLQNKNIIQNFESINNEKAFRKKANKSNSPKDLLINNIKYKSNLNIEYPFESFKFRDRYYMSFGFTTNLFLEDGLNYCLNAICWIEHHECYETHEQGTLKTHFIYINIFFINKLGEIVSGKQIHLNFKTQAQKVPNAGAYAYELKLLTDIEKTVHQYLSKGKKLHEEIFIEKKYKFEGGAEFNFSDKDFAYNILKKASINNRTSDTNCIYSAVGEKKEEFENILDWISIAAIPFDVPLKFIKPLQKVLEFIAYASDLDSQTKIIDKLFDMRGPFPLSLIYQTSYALEQFVDPYGTTIGGYKQIQKGKVVTYDEDFIMEEILTILQNDITKNNIT